MTAGYSYFQNDNAFEFYTKFGASYLVTFTKVDAYFPSVNRVKDYIYSIDIQLIDPGPFNNLDIVVSITIAEIIFDFFEQDNRNVLFYTCDPIDGRMNARIRKFNNWFLYFNNGDFKKLVETVQSSNFKVLASFIFHKNNPFAYDLPTIIDEAKDNLGNK
jgi:hypothetical protein